VERRVAESHVRGIVGVMSIENKLRLEREGER